MPVAELIRYFNAADRAGDSMLYPNGTRIEAWHAGLRLGSLFRPIVDLHAERVVGHQASLHAWREDGTAVSAEAAYQATESPGAVVHFDRLCRTLHALNFLSQRRHTGGYLQLAVHPRHLQAVQNQHGLVYEAILKRCGLAPDDIVLDIDPDALETTQHVVHALENYRERGYRLAVRAPADATRLPGILALRPDLLRTTIENHAVLAAARRAGIPVEGMNIDQPAHYQAAVAHGIERGQGLIFGGTRADCHATHKSPPAPTISHPRLETAHENRQ